MHKLYSSLLLWIQGARWRRSLSHVFLAPIIQVPVAYLTGSALAGILGVLLWYWSRKKLEIEFEKKVPHASNVTVWTEGWFPWTWGWDKQLDVLLPLLTSGLLSLILPQG